MKKWKEMLVKNSRSVQICGCICLIGILGFGIYSLQEEGVPTRKTEAIVKEQNQEENTTKKEEKRDKDISKKKEIENLKVETKKVDEESKKDIVKKESSSAQQKDMEKKEEKKSDSEMSEQQKEQKSQEDSALASQQPAQPEQEPQETPESATQQPSQPEQKPQENPTPAPQQPSQPEQKPQEHVHNWVYHKEQGHENTYTVTEEVYEPWECCNVCGADCTADPSGHMEAHALAGEGGGRHTEYFKTKEVTKTEWVIDVPAYTECSGCGARQ